MPILGAETTLYPKTLLDATGLTASDRQWMVVYTKARQEKALARDLLRREIPFYLPVVKRTCLYRGRRRARYLPLFSGYVFVRFRGGTDIQPDHQSRFAGAAGSGLGAIGARTAEPAATDRRERPLTVESRLATGRRVRVRQGPFAGIEGTVLVRRGETRLLVSINFLQQGASVEIDDFQLEPID